MVSFWPWKGDETSPASFEKALSTQSAKIVKASSKLESLRQRSRRFNVLWTLYAGFAYLVCCLILVLVVGWKNWGVAEYTGLTLGPGVIYLGRLALTTYYDYRTSTAQAHLDHLEKQRNETIAKLKSATKYDSTAELLKKYGGSPSAGKEKQPKRPDQKSQQQSAPQGQRTHAPPPPTANIPNRRESIPPPQQNTPQQKSPVSRLAPSPPSPSADFAPNAFASPPQYAQPTQERQWYDRFMDVLLGEDESLPGKRLALICQNCRLVNGQAPPGVRSLADVGKWKCFSCGSMNGEDDEVKRIVKRLQSEGGEMEEKSKGGVKGGKGGATKLKNEVGDEAQDSESDVTQYSEEEDEAYEEAKDLKSEEPEAPTRRSKRVRQKKVED